ncbi:MAG: DUF11 domain-containing protein [Chloroflexi bacterium]|nr:DUF11 domain-containing protein [Chloroflexota bacterium]
MRISLSLSRAIIGLLLGVVLLIGLMAGAAPMARAGSQATPGVDANFYKVGVIQTGMYALTYDALAAAGLPVGVLDPATLQLYEQGVEIGRDLVDANANSVFDSGDYLLFYGRGADTYFTHTNIYWLTYGAAPGQPMTSRSGAPDGGLPAVTTFRETLHFEQNKLFQSDVPITGPGDHWYWQLYQPTCDRFGVCTPATLIYPLIAPNVATGGAYTAALTPRLRGYTYRGHLGVLWMNGSLVGQASFNFQDEFLGSLTFPQGVMIAGSNTLTVTAPVDGSSTQDRFFINWFALTYERTYDAPAGQFRFGVDATAPAQVTLLGVGDVGTAVFDVTDPTRPVRLTGLVLAGSAAVASERQSAPAADLTFGHLLSAAAKYIAASPSQHLSAVSITADTPSDLRNEALGADWIIISHQDFLPAAEALAQHRRTVRGFRAAVVDVQDIYDEFNGGLADQESIRTFIRYAYENWPRPAPRYVALLGDGTYDPRNYLGFNWPSFVPPYLLATDPFDGVTASDNRYVAYDPPPGVVNPLPFMSLGRLPANSLADAWAMVNKIIAYETTPAHDDWNRHVVFVADAADYAGNFPVSSNMVADDPSLLPVEYNREKIYFKLDPKYSTVADTRAAIVNAINSGALLVNYHGHASRQAWSGSQFFNLTALGQLTNTGKYPVMLPMTCLEGNFISPGGAAQSLGESIVRIPNGGAVASWSPTGKGIATGHETLYTHFYEAVFELGITELGPATDYAKQVLYNGTSPFKDLLDTYILFGDPAMSMDLPAPDVWVQKSATPAPPWQPGQHITYTIAYGNLGAVTATGVVITDALPAEIVSATWSASDPGVAALPGPALAWQTPNLAPGASGVITVAAAVSPGASSGVTLTNIVTITTTTPERLVDGTNNRASHAGLVRPGTATLGGRIYNDVNANGAYDVGEPPVPNLTITVRDASGIVASPLSDSQGLWSVVVAPGVYTVTVPWSTSAYLLSTSQTITSDLSGGGSGMGLNFGYVAPTGLEIEYFRAQWATNGGLLLWATRAEAGLVEFNLYRSTFSGAYGKRINPAAILPKAPPGQGAQYSFSDGQVTPGARVYYWLQVVGRDDVVIWLGPVAPVWPVRAFLPLIPGGDQ